MSNAINGAADDVAGLQEGAVRYSGPWTKHNFWPCLKSDKSRDAFIVLFKHSKLLEGKKTHGPADGTSLGMPPEDAYLTKNYELRYDKPLSCVYIPRKFLPATNGQFGSKASQALEFLNIPAKDRSDKVIDSMKELFKDIIGKIRDSVDAKCQTRLVEAAKNLEIKYRGRTIASWRHVRRGWREELTEERCEQMYNLMYKHWDEGRGFDKLTYEILLETGFWHLVYNDDDAKNNKSTVMAQVKATFGDKYRKNIFKNGLNKHGVKVFKNGKNRTGNFIFDLNVKGWKEYQEKQKGAVEPAAKPVGKSLATVEAPKVLSLSSQSFGDVSH